MAGNFGGKIIWRIAEILTFGGIYFGDWESPSHNDIHIKMANRMRWEFNWAVRLVSLDCTTPTQKQRTGCWSSSVSGRQRHQRRSLQRPCTHRLDCVNKPTLLPPLVSGDVISSYTAVDGEVHADDYTGAPRCRPIVHVEVMITNIDGWNFGGWNIGGLLLKPPIRQNFRPYGSFIRHTLYCWSSNIPNKASTPNAVLPSYQQFLP